MERVWLNFKDSNGDVYFDIVFDIVNQIFESDNNQLFLSKLEIYSYWNDHLESSINSYIQSIMVSNSYNYIDSYFKSYFKRLICGESRNNGEGEDSCIRTHAQGSDLTIRESSNDSNDSDGTQESSNDSNQKYDYNKDLWVRCQFCNSLNSRQFLKERMNTCQNCGHTLKSDGTIESSKDPTNKKKHLWVQCKYCDTFNFKELLKERMNICEGCGQTFKSDEIENDSTDKYKDLWVLCKDCYQLNYKKLLKERMNICEGCGYHLPMSSSDRIELSIDPGTWHPMDEDMVYVDPFEFLAEEEEEKDSSFEFLAEEEEEEEEESFKEKIESSQKKTGLPDAVQTGTGLLNGIPVAIGVMDFQFIGGSMGSVVGEKITRLIEYATAKHLPLIIVCASGGARVQEGSVSLMQMAKISSALYNYQSNTKLFYVSILTSPTTGGVMASFGMLGDIVIAEPNATIAFAGKRVIEETLNITVPEGVQETEYLFEKGVFDLIVPRKLLKRVLAELFKLHDFVPSPLAFLFNLITN